MKKILIVLFLVSTIHAQVQKKHLLGIEGGPSFSTSYYSRPIYPSAVTPALAFYTALSYTYSFSKHIGFKMNAAFENKDYLLTFVTGGIAYNTPVLMNGYYASLNPQIRFRFGSKTAFTLDCGSFIGFSTEHNYAWPGVDLGFNLSPGFLVPIGNTFAISIISRNSVSYTGATYGTPQSTTFRFFSSNISVGLNVRL